MSNLNVAQSTGTAESTDCLTAEKKNSPNDCPEYDTKKSDGEALVMIELWGMLSASLLPSLQVHSVPE